MQWPLPLLDECAARFGENDQGTSVDASERSLDDHHVRLPALHELSRFAAEVCQPRRLRHCSLAVDPTDRKSTHAGALGADDAVARVKAAGVEAENAHEVVGESAVPKRTARL